MKNWPGEVCPTDKVGSVFGCNVDGSLANQTLLQALSFKGGSTIAGAQQILLRAATAALLNSITLCYPLSTEEILCLVDQALASGNRKAILDLAAYLDDFNNLGL